MLPSDEDVVDQGFQPLKRTPTMPTNITGSSKGEAVPGKRNSFRDVATGCTYSIRIQLLIA
jgi:hypothetical protein